MKFELLPEKITSKCLAADDHIMLNDQIWRVVVNYPVIGGGGRMLMLAFHTHQNPRGYKFHPSADEVRFEVFRRID